MDWEKVAHTGSRSWRVAAVAGAAVLLVGLLWAGVSLSDSVAAQSDGAFSIETVDGEDADQVNDVTYHNEAGFELTVDGIDPEEWFVIVEVGDHRTSTTVDGQTVAVEPRPHDLEAGTVYTLTVIAKGNGTTKTAETQVRLTDTGDFDGPKETLRVSADYGSYDVPPGEEPTQELRFDVDLVEQTETSLHIRMFGDDGLPEEMDVTSVSAESPWPTQVTQTDAGVRVTIDGTDGPKSGELLVTVDFDASDVYEEGAEVQRGPRYVLEDENGEGVGNLHVNLWQRSVYVVVETPGGERLTPDTDRENWRDYYKRGIDPYDPAFEVFSGDGSGYHSNSSFSVPTADGVWEFRYEPERYIRVRADGYADPVVSMSDIDQQRHKWRDDPYVVQLSEGGAVEIALADEDGEPFPDGRIHVENETGIAYRLEADEDGVVRANLSPGTYSGWAGAYTALPEPEVEFTVEAGEQIARELTLRTPEVVDSDVEHVAGSSPDLDAIDVDSLYYEGAVLVSLAPTDADAVSREDAERAGLDATVHDLSEFGVDETTELRVTLEIESFDPDALAGAARDTTWRVVEQDGDRTVVELETSAANLQLHDEMHTGFGNGDVIDWPTGDEDVADTEYGAAVNVMLFDVDAIGGQGDTVQGLSVTTNAQVFSAPQIADGGLDVYLAAPGETVDGEQHTGYYQTFLPDSLLAKWNVDDPESDLEVAWRGEETRFEIEDVDGGVYVEIDPVHYSEGTMSVRALTAQQSGTGIPWLWVGVAGAVAVAIAVALLVFRRRSASGE